MQVALLLLWWMGAAIFGHFPHPVDSTVQLGSDGRYSNIVVGISPTVPETKGQRIIEAIKRIFNSAAPVLLEATRGSVTFGQVTIVVPRSWSTSSYGRASAHESFWTSDVRVTDPNPVHGDAPYTQRSQGCGLPGDFVHLTPSYLFDDLTSSSKYGHAGKVLTHEWVHYRYGVFDEYGFRGDRRYPAAYMDQGTLKPTVCTDAELRATLSDTCAESPSNYDCFFRAEVNQTGIHSSMMSLHFLPDVVQFCDQGTHNKYAPTPQNDFCSGLSVWEVMGQHPDFRNRTGTGAVALPVTFRVVRPTSGRFVLVLDISADMNVFVKNNPQMQRIALVEAAAVGFVTDLLPDGSSLGLVAFGSGVEVLKELTVVNSQTRNGFVNALPRLTQVGRERNTFAALNEALRMLSTGERTDGDVIIVTNGKSDHESAYAALEDDLNRRGVRLSVVLFPPPQEPNRLPYLAAVTGGNCYSVTEVGAGQRGNSSTTAQLTNAFRESIAAQYRDPYSDPVVVYEMVHASDSEVIRGTFSLDSSVGKNTVVSLKYYMNIVNFKLQVTSPKGTRFGPDHYKNDLAGRAIVLSIADSDASVGMWNYEFRANPLEDQPLTLVVTSRPKDDAPLTLRCWTNAPGLGLNASDTTVAIFAELRRGSSPVINARVVAVVKRPQINNTYSDVSVELLDSGSGAPDLTARDGIYSRYFTNYVFPTMRFGFYSVVVTATDNNGRAQVVHLGPTLGNGIYPLDPEEAPCCGSEVSLNSGTEPTGTFQRVSPTPAFLVLEPPPADADLYPPSKIRDLSVDFVDPMTGYVTVSWTAPGDDFDSGQAESYEFRYATDRERLSERLFYSAPKLVESLTVVPLEAGARQQMTFSTPEERDRIYYLAGRTKDDSGRWSGRSNVASAYVPPAPTTIAPSTPEPSGPATGNPTGPGSSTMTPTEYVSSAELVAIVVGSLAAILLLVVVGFVMYFTWVGRRRRLERQKEEALETKGPALSTNGFQPQEPVNNVAKSVGETTTPNGTGTALSPYQFMSASELLSRHEKTAAADRNDSTNTAFYLYDEHPTYQAYPIYSPLPTGPPGSQGPIDTAFGLGVPLGPGAYVNSSFDDASENSTETSRLRSSATPPVGGVPVLPMGVHPIPKRVMSESQV